jgi:tRNA threonylcarbamoyladenosine biosynthesis protein TsaB
LALILSLDTTTRSGSVAIVRDGRVVHEQVGGSELTHAQRLPGELMTACDAAGISIADVEMFAVAAGPGSFTGLRVGIATIQGLAMARGRTVVAISALEALAEAAPGTPRRVAAWMDAQRGEVFAQVFEPSAGVQVPLTEPVSARPPVALELQAGEVSGATFHGDGAIRYRAQIFAAMGPSAQILESVAPLAGAIGRIAAAQPDRAVLPHAVVPIYIRKPDAEIARDQRSSPP